MIVNQRPQYSSSLGTDHWILVVLRQVSHETREEVIVLQEVDFIRSVFECRVSDEEEDQVDQLSQRRHRFLASRNCDCIQDKESQIEGWLDFKDLLRTFFRSSEAAEETHEVDHEVLHHLNVFIILALRQKG